LLQILWRTHRLGISRHAQPSVSPDSHLLLVGGRGRWGEDVFKGCFNLCGNSQVYRLISCGTVEEKIYRKQVFKGGLSRSGMKEGVPFQYFTQQVILILICFQH
jgi:hypothetical protein